jgi:hypothetical protein
LSVDKYELVGAVLNVDITEYVPDRPLYIVGILTIENVGWDDSAVFDGRWETPTTSLLRKGWARRLASRNAGPRCAPGSGRSPAPVDLGSRNGTNVVSCASVAQPLNPQPWFRSGAGLAVPR